MGQDTYEVYQLDESRFERDIVHNGSGMVKTVGEHLDPDNFIHTYTGTLGLGKTSDLDTLHGVMDKLINETPEGFTYSLTMGDVIVLRDNGSRAYVMSEAGGYLGVPCFLDKLDGQRPVGVKENTLSKNAPPVLKPVREQLADAEKHILRSAGASMKTHDKSHDGGGELKHER